MSSLSPQQKRAFRLILEGRSLQDIGVALRANSARTRRILQKARIRLDMKEASNKEAARKARQLKML